ERLEGIMLESHNYALAPELLILLEMRAVAVTARGGDPVFAKVQLDQLGGMLALVTDAERFASEQRRLTGGAGKWLVRIVAAKPLRSHVAWPLAQGEIRATAGALEERLNASPPPAHRPELVDNNPENDIFGVLLVVGFKNLPPSVSSYLSQSFYFVPVSEPNRHMANLIIGIDGPHNASEFGLVILLSLVPAFDLINDLIPLLIEEDPFVTTVAAVGLTLTLAEIALILFPGAQAAAPPVIIADSMAAGVRASYKAALAAVDDDVAEGFVRAFAELNEEAAEASFELTSDLVSVVTRRVIDSNEEATPEAFEALLRADLWDNYFHYVDDMFRRNPDLLQTLGFDEGGEVLGAMFRQFREEGLDLTDEHIVAIHDIALEAFEDAGLRFGDEAAHGMGIVARNLEPDQLRRLSDAVDDPEIFGRVLANASLWDETAEGGFAKLARGGWLAEEQAGLLVRLVDDPDILERSLSLVGRSAREAWQPQRVDTLADVFISARAVNLDPAAVDLFPHTALDSRYFPGFAEYLRTDRYLAERASAVNEAVESGTREQVVGHLVQVLGGYRELRGIGHAENVLGHKRVFSHFTAEARVNEPGLDAITRWVDPETNEVFYFAWETKNSSYALGALIDDFTQSSSGRVGPGQIQRYFAVDDFGNQFIDANYLTTTVDDLATRRLLGIEGVDLSPDDIRDEIIMALEDNRFGLFFFGGGREFPFTKGITDLDGRSVPHPQLPSVDVDLRVVLDG
ncbi:MAG: hypothetical protein R3191_07675, partial [Anaerolineales bacterium]|nr:hypothetical protein [Anaerolineales bacterium]